jgi:hypothetical protein
MNKSAKTLELFSVVVRSRSVEKTRIKLISCYQILISTVRRQTKRYDVSTQGFMGGMVATRIRRSGLLGTTTE